MATADTTSASASTTSRVINNGAVISSWLSRMPQMTIAPTIFLINTMTSKRDYQKPLSLLW